MLFRSLCNAIWTHYRGRWCEPRSCSAARPAWLKGASDSWWLGFAKYAKVGEEIEITARDLPDSSLASSVRWNSPIHHPVSVIIFIQPLNPSALYLHFIPQNLGFEPAWLFLEVRDNRRVENFIIRKFHLPNIRSIDCTIPEEVK